MQENKGSDNLGPVGLTLGRRSEVSFSRKLHNIVWRLVNVWIFPLTLRSHRLRCSLLRLFGASVGKDVRVGATSKIEFPGNLAIGHNSSIGDGCYIQGLDQINIGANVCVSDGVYLLTGSHDLASANFALITRSVTLEDGVWLAVRAMVLPGVTLERGAVAGAGAVVHKSFDEFSIVAGNPAVMIGRRKLRRSRPAV